MRRMKVCCPPMRCNSSSRTDPEVPGARASNCSAAKPRHESINRRFAHRLYRRTAPSGVVTALVLTGAPGACALRLLLTFALRGFYARPERGHQIAYGTRACHRELLRRLRGWLASEKLEQLLAVFVRVLFGHPARGHRSDELPSGLHLAVGDRDVAESADQLGRASHLVREEQRFECERIAQGPDGDDVRLGPEDKPSDPDHPGALHRAKEQRVRLLGAHTPRRRDVIALLVEDGVDVGETHELLDLDRPAPLGSDRYELVVGDSDS